VLVPEVGLAAEILETVKVSYETLKPAAELVKKANEQLVVTSVEQATDYLQELTKMYAEDVADNALQLKKNMVDAVEPALDSYVKENPQVFDPVNAALFKALCDGIGIKEPDPEEIKMEVWRKVFPPFKEQVLVVAAQIHFFRELDDDFERLDFLMEEAEKGNDPDALLSLIGGDRVYWDEFLKVYRSRGKEAAKTALAGHLGLPTWSH
jgi:flagellar hook-length control protein FliK